MTSNTKAPSVAQKVDALFNSLARIGLGQQETTTSQLTAIAAQLDELQPRLSAADHAAGEAAQYIPPERIILDMAKPEDRAEFIRYGGDPDNPGAPLVIREGDGPQPVKAAEAGKLPKQPGRPPAVRERGLTSDTQRQAQIDYLNDLQLIAATTTDEAQALDALRLRAIDLLKSRFVPKLKAGALQVDGHRRITAILRIIIDPPARPDPVPAPVQVVDAGDDQGEGVSYERLH